MQTVISLLNRHTLPVLAFIFGAVASLALCVFALKAITGVPITLAVCALSGFWLWLGFEIDRRAGTDYAARAATGPVRPEERPDSAYAAWFHLLAICVWMGGGLAVLAAHIRLGGDAQTGATAYTLAMLALVALGLLTNLKRLSILSLGLGIGLMLPGDTLSYSNLVGALALIIILLHQWDALQAWIQKIPGLRARRRGAGATVGV